MLQWLRKRSVTDPGAGQAEALFLLYVMPSLMLMYAVHTDSSWHQWVDSLENINCDT